MMNLLTQDTLSSTIVIVPDEFSPDSFISGSTGSNIVLNASNNSIVSRGNSVVSSIQIYRGSIIAIEKHPNDEKSSNLTIRVPNFPNTTSSLINATDSIENGNETSIQTMVNLTSKVKRRAPICPIGHGTTNIDWKQSANQTSDSKIRQEEKSSKFSNDILITHRISSGLRSLSRALTHGCRSNRSTNVKDAIIPTSLPDVEVMKDTIPCLKSSGKIQTPVILRPKNDIQCEIIDQYKMNIKSEPFTSTLTKLPKMKTVMLENQLVSCEGVEKQKKRTTSFIRRGNDGTKETEHIEKQEPASNQYQFEVGTPSTTTMNLVSEITESFPVLSQMIHSTPVTPNEKTSLSPHRYSTISAIVSDIKQIVEDPDIDRISVATEPSEVNASSIKDERLLVTKLDNQMAHIITSVLKPDISVVRVGLDQSTKLINNKKSDSYFQIIEETEEMAGSRGQPDRDTLSDEEHFSESYEINYQLDPCFIPNDLMNELNTSLESSITDFSSNNNDTNHTDRSECKSTRTPETPWASFLPIVHTNLYENIDSEISESNTNSTIVQHLDSSIKEGDQQTMVEDFSRIHLQDQPNVKSRSLNNIKGVYVESPISTPFNQKHDYLQLEFPSKRKTVRQSSSSDEHYVLTHRFSDGFHAENVDDLTNAGAHQITKQFQEDSTLSVNSATTLIEEDYTIVLQMIRNHNQSPMSVFDDDRQNLQDEFEKFYASTKSMA